MDTAPILLFVYNRPWHTEQTINALKKNELADHSDLIIYSDGPKQHSDNASIKEVRSYLSSLGGFKSITLIEREINLGLAQSIISGVTQTFEKYDRVIVLEDDMISSTNFLKFMNNTLDFYKKNRKIFAISGYGYPIKIPADYKYDVYLGYRGSPWGWGMWKDRWDLIDWNVKDIKEFKNNKESQKLFNRGGDDLTRRLINCVEKGLDIWSIKRTYAQFKAKAYTLYPTVSKIQNIGLDGTGANCTKTKLLDIDLDPAKLQIFLPVDIEFNEEINIEIRTLFSTKKIFKLIRLFNPFNLFQ